MEDTFIRKSTLEDLSRMLEIYARAREFMKNTGNPNQWRVYPQSQLLLEDIRQGRSYVAEKDGRVFGTFVFAEGSDPTYSYIEGKWLNDRPYGTIHRIAGDGTVKGLLDLAVRYALSKVNDVRLDTHSDNRVMQRAAEKLGFVKCGIIYVTDDMGERSPRFAYHKTV